MSYRVPDVRTLLLAEGGLLMVATAAAQTPDGQTPAEETVCDPLMDDGVTKGLYGLCVAFCEAQDHSSLNAAITEAELEALESEAPSGRVLANYNKKKKETDPAMPCIKVEESCPCWSAEDLAGIDGFAPDYTATEQYFCNTGQWDLVALREFAPLHMAWSHLLESTPEHGPIGYCLYVDEGASPQIFRHLTFHNGTLSMPQARACNAQVRARCVEAGLLSP